MSLENNFKEKLYDLETPLGGNVSFEKVMAMRRKKGAPIWWKPAILVVATMSAVTLTGFLWFGNGSSRLTKSTNPPIVAKQNPTNKQGANISTDIESNTQNVATPNVAPQTNAAEKSSNSRRNSKTAAAQKPESIRNQNAVSESKATAEKIKVAPVENAPTWLPSGLFGFGLRMHPAKLNMNGAIHINPATRHKDPFTPSPFIPDYAELMLYTGTQNYDKFQSDKDFAIRGNHRSAQYSAIALWNLAYGLQLGAGVGYGQTAGTGVWRQTEVKQEVTITSRVVTVYQPGMPPKYVTVYDTAVNAVKTSQTGDIQYTASKLSLPLALRMNFGEGRMLFRVSATLAPGLLTQSSGVAFNRESHAALQRNAHSFVLDSRFGAGLYYTLSPRMALIAEPSLNLQRIQGVPSMSRINYGLGFGILIKP
jgi:hypothetical protein